MATTGMNFVEVTTTSLTASTVTTAPYVEALDPISAKNIEQGGAGVCLDEVHVHLGLTRLPVAGDGTSFNVKGKVLGNYSKNGAAIYSTTGTTPISPDLTAINTGAASSAGDLAFATVNTLVFRNLGAADMTIAPGGSNPSNAPKFTGTTPTLALPAGSVVVWHSAAGVTVDSTHKVILVTPTAGGVFSISVGGA